MTHVHIVEVGPRDGLQILDRVVRPELRVQLAERALRAGIPEVEAASFVREDLVPTMAGAAEVVAALPASGVTALAINRRGVELAAAAGVERLRILALVSDEFSRRNSNVTAADGLERAAGMIALAQERGITATGIVGTAFGCPFEGEIAPSAAVAMAERLIAAGASALVFADTIGVATPRQVRELLRAMRGAGVPLGGHFHNTRNTGYANALAAVEEGATILDASTAGLGGCPFAPAATGNIATEDLVYLLDGEGIDTGVDLAETIATARWFTDAIGAPLASMLPLAGDRPRASNERPHSSHISH